MVPYDYSSGFYWLISPMEAKAAKVVKVKVSIFLLYNGCHENNRGLIVLAGQELATNQAATGMARLIG